MLMILRGRRYAQLPAALLFLIGLIVIPSRLILSQSNSRPSVTWMPPPPPPPVEDPFPRLSAGEPLPPVPLWNRPRPNMYRDYGLDFAPPLLIGFTRGWPLLLQTVVSYIAAGWPPDQIYVIENTGVHRANELGKLTLQHPFFLDATALARLGVHYVRTPVRLTFSQLQNFFISFALDNRWPWYLWGHQDVVALSFENGEGGPTAKYNEDGYRSIYELCLFHINDTLHNEPRWGVIYFAYDHLSLVRVEATEDIGGWDTLIPFYISDCDFYARLEMGNWTKLERSVGHVTDVSATFRDLAVLYRDPALIPSYVDPNPPPMTDSPAGPLFTRQSQDDKERNSNDVGINDRDSDQDVDAALAYWHQLYTVCDQMYHYKHGDRGRNTWQMGQRGGQGEPYYYPAIGLHRGIELLNTAGKQVFAQKWGHRDCDLIEAGRKATDVWAVEPDWKD